MISRLDQAQRSIVSISHPPPGSGPNCRVRMSRHLALGGSDQGDDRAIRSLQRCIQLAVGWPSLRSARIEPADSNLFLSDERAESGDRPANDETVHLARAFKGVNRFGIGEWLGHAVFKHNPITPEDLAAHGDRLASARRHE